MKNLEEEEPKWRIRMMMNTTSFSTIYLSIFRKQNTQKRFLFLIDFLNLDKMIRIVSINKTEIRKKLPIWRNRFMRCKIRMDFKTSKIKITFLDKMILTMDLCFRNNILSLDKMEAGYLLRVPRSQRLVNSSAKEIWTIRWKAQMMQHLDNLSSIQCMLRKKIPAKKRMLLIKCWDKEILSPVRAAATLLRRRSCILRFWVLSHKETTLISIQSQRLNLSLTNLTINRMIN